MQNINRSNKATERAILLFACSDDCKQQQTKQNKFTIKVTYYVCYEKLMNFSF